MGDYWIVSPETRHVSVFRRTEQGFAKALLVASGSVRSFVLPGLEMPLAEIFAGVA